MCAVSTVCRWSSALSWAIPPRHSRAARRPAALPLGPCGVFGPHFQYLTVLYFYFVKMHRKRKHGLTTNVPETKPELTTCSCHRSGVGVGGLWPPKRSVGQLFNCTGRNSTTGGWTGGWAMGGEVRQSVAPGAPGSPHPTRGASSSVVWSPSPVPLAHFGASSRSSEAQPVSCSLPHQRG